MGKHDDQLQHKRQENLLIFTIPLQCYSDQEVKNMYELRCFCVHGSTVENSIVSVGDAGLDTINSMMCGLGEFVHFNCVGAIYENGIYRSVTAEFVGKNRVAIIVVRMISPDKSDDDVNVFNKMRQKAFDAAMLKANWQ